MPDDKTMSNTNPAQAKAAGVTVFGDPDLWKCVGKAFNEAEGWMKSTKVMDVPGGVVMQVSTQQRNNSGSYSIAEAVTFVPGVHAAELMYKPQEDVQEESQESTYNSTEGEVKVEATLAESSEAPRDAEKTAKRTSKRLQ